MLANNKNMKRREKFVYNPHTLQYDKVVEPLRITLLRVFGFICMALLFAATITAFSHKYFPSPEAKALRKENKALRGEIATVQKDVNRVNEVLNKINDRHNYAHRLIYGMNPIDAGIWEGGIGGHDKYEDIKTTFQYSGEELAQLKTQIDKLEHKLATESESLDQIVALAKDNEAMLASIPSIKPVREDKLARDTRLLSGFGMRIHPVYKVPKMHTGIDFTAPSGTPIQATGAGTVEKVDSRTEYGNRVTINHGFGYKTMYAHMKTVDVKVGQKLTRGQQIGTVGSTGTSTAPHCHYEVIYKGKKINPINYVLDGLNPKEYQELVEAAESANQSMD